MSAVGRNSDGDMVFTQSITHEGELRSTARVRELPPFALDEPVELGGGDTAPCPMDYLLSAAGGCLLASLAHCLRIKRVEARLSMEVSGTVRRNEEKLLRVASIHAVLHVAAAEADRAKVAGCYEIFKKYCIVSASIAQGIPLTTELDFRAAG
jgi:uncharacterized OsmC-like protein